jgi:pimeloyl-[acyl-carrier protein] synthase
MSESFDARHDERAGVAAAQQALMADLFSEVGRDDPQAVLAAAAIPGVRYAFVREVLHDPRFTAPAVPDSPDLIFQLLARFLPRLPQDRHRVIRGRFSGLFTPRRVERYRDVIEAKSADLIDLMQTRRSGDLVRDFAAPLPFTVIAQALGVPPERHAWLLECLGTLGRGFAGQRSRQPVELANAAAADMLAYFDELLHERAVSPADDLASLLASELSEHEVRQDLLANCIFFMLAGHLTTTTLLCGGTQLLWDHPDQAQSLRTNPGGWDTAIEEMLRFISPTTLTGVTATTDAAVDGYHVAVGEHLTVVYAAANRDPRIFHDPDRFVADRAINPHVAFSAGSSFCLGAPLARLHGQVAFPMLMERLPLLRPNGSPVWRGSVPVRQIEAMPSAW